MIYDLDHGHMALLVIDVQLEYFDPDGPTFVEHAADILENVNRLVDGFRARGLPVVFVKHMNRADGSDAGRMGDFADQTKRTRSSRAHLGWSLSRASR